MLCTRHRLIQRLNIRTLGCGKHSDACAVDGGRVCEAGVRCGGVGSGARWRGKASLDQVAAACYYRGARGCGSMDCRDHSYMCMTVHPYVE